MMPLSLMSFDTPVVTITGVESRSVMGSPVGVFSCVQPLVAKTSMLQMTIRKRGMCFTLSNAVMTIEKFQTMAECQAMLLV